MKLDNQTLVQKNGNPRPMLITNSLFFLAHLARSLIMCQMLINESWNGSQQIT